MVKELSPEERERMKSVLSVDDAGLDDWLKRQEAEVEAKNNQSFDLSEDELVLIAKEREVMRACWAAVDDVMVMPTDHPSMPVDKVWNMHTKLAVALYNGVVGRRCIGA